MFLIWLVGIFIAARRATCPASSPTPRRTSRPRSCRATRSRPRCSRPRRTCRAASWRPAVDRLPARVGPDAGGPAEDRRGRRAADRGALPGRRGRRRHGGVGWPGAEGGQGGGAPRRQACPRAAAGPTTPIPGQPDDYAPFVGPICSQDGKAAIVTAYIKGDGESDSILDPVEFWRDTVSDPGGGLEVKITGGAGYAADAIKVFEGINGTLLLAAVSLVIFLLIVIYRSPIFLFIPLAAVIFAEMLARSVGLRALRARA